jgi:NAD(P)-dependent dehydrogenase (short-subunit alcohol dehydrogenase family)
VELTGANGVKDTIVLTHEGMAEARDARAHLESLGWRVLTVPKNVCLWSEAALTAFAEPLGETLAGVIHPAPERILGGVASVSEADWERAANEGPMAAWCVTKVFCGLMAQSGGGSMIYLNSIHAEKPVGMGALFSMGCGAVQMLSREAAQDYGEFGVHTYFIQKGVSQTDPDSRSPVSSLYFGVDLRYPERRMPEAGYLNDLIAFLLTPGAAALSGSDLRADGGMTLYYVHRRKVEGRPYYEY